MSRYQKHTHTHPFNGPFSGTTQVSRYQKGKTNLDFTEARDSEWQWHQLGHMQVCILLQTDNHASTQPLKFFYRPDAFPATQPCQSTEGTSSLTSNITLLSHSRKQVSQDCQTKSRTSTVQESMFSRDFMVWC